MDTGRVVRVFAAKKALYWWRYARKPARIKMEARFYTLSFKCTHESQQTPRVPRFPARFGAPYTSRTLGVQQCFKLVQWVTAAPTTAGDPVRIISACGFHRAGMSRCHPRRAVTSRIFGDFTHHFDVGGQVCVGNTRISLLCVYPGTFPCVAVCVAAARVVNCVNRTRRAPSDTGHGDSGHGSVWGR